MVKKLGCGCLGLVGVFLVIIVIAAMASPKPAGQTVAGQPTGSADLPTVGQTASKGGWEVTLNEFGTYEEVAGRAPSTPAQGKLIVIGFTAKNLQNSTSNFTSSDFSVVAGDKRKFNSAGQTASIDKGFMLSQTVQPGLQTENRVVFDIDPAATDLTLNALGLQFTLPSV